MSDDVKTPDEVNNTTSEEINKEVKSEVKSAAPAEGAGETKDARPERPERPERPAPRGGHGDSGRSQFQRVPRFKKKICKFCYIKDMTIDYKKPEILERFLTDRGKILPRRITGTCAKHQRVLAKEVKRARMIALLPFVEQ